MIEGTATAAASAERLRPGEVALLLLPLFTVALGYGAVLPLLPSLITRLHASGVHSGLPLHAGLLTH